MGRRRERWPPATARRRIRRAAAGGSSMPQRDRAGRRHWGHQNRSPKGRWFTSRRRCARRPHDRKPKQTLRRSEAPFGKRSSQERVSSHHKVNESQASGAKFKMQTKTHRLPEIFRKRDPGSSVAEKRKPETCSSLWCGASGSIWAARNLATAGVSGILTSVASSDSKSDNAQILNTAMTPWGFEPQLSERKPAITSKGFRLCGVKTRPIFAQAAGPAQAGLSPCFASSNSAAVLGDRRTCLRSSVQGGRLAVV